MTAGTAATRSNRGQGGGAATDSGGTRSIVVGPYLAPRRIEGATATPQRAPQARLAEAEGLARAIDLKIVRCEAVSLQALRPATYLGKGKVEEIGLLIKAQEVAVAVLDCALSPVQQRNLEKAWSCKVIDRTGLILEIFGERALTREGSLQVELAHLNYQKSRLVRSWTHLERQRGGFGFMGGPGETQIETDRRLIQDRVRRIERELKDVTRTRALHRAGRKRTPFPIVALVGYTNAGKSTLFNRLTGAEVLAKDMLFATLDPTARAVRLPHGGTVVFSDTVGFISDLPTMLVAAFRATLEDVIDADLILHVRDLSHEDSAAQNEDVNAVLRDLGLDSGSEKTILEVWNKVDLIDESEREGLRQKSLAIGRTGPKPSLVSAVTGEGTDDLLATIERLIAGTRPVYVVTVDASDGRGLSWLHANVEVLDRRIAADGDTVAVVRVAPERVATFSHRFPSARLRATPAA